MIGYSKEQQIGRYSMYCEVDGCGRYVENPESGLCSSHARLYRKKQIDSTPSSARKSISKISPKRKKELEEYHSRRKSFLMFNKTCGVCGKIGADSIHHKRGRVGYADDEARDEGVSLLLDERFWLPIHSYNYNVELGMSCHQYIEKHPEYAKEKGFSENRLQ